MPGVGGRPGWHPSTHVETRGTAVRISIFLDEENSLISRAISDTEPQPQLSPGAVEGTLTPERFTAVKNTALLARKAAVPAACSHAHQSKQDY